MEIPYLSLTLGVWDSSFNGHFPSYNKPSVIGGFSVDSVRNYRGDLSQLKYMHIPSTNSVDFNLDLGRKSAIKKDEEIDEKLDNILRWILESSENIKWVPPEFVCFRGLLTMLMCTPYEKEESWIILASKYKGTIFLCAKETQEKRGKREQMTERQKQFMSWGYKFEQYMTSEKPDGAPDATAPVNEREELCVLFRTKLSAHHLLIAAEVDGINSKTEVNDWSTLAQVELIELKTSRHIESERQDRNFRRFKLLKWWGQSFLVGIKRIVCGFRDDRGVVHKLENFEVSRLPKMAVEHWNPSVCMNFCDRFLSFVKRVVQLEKGPGVVWKFDWQPNSTDVRVAKITGASDFAILPKWFTDQW